MNQFDRMEYLIGLLKQLDPKIDYDENYEINKASLKKLCAYDGPPYQRVKVWLEKKVAGLPKISPATDSALFREQLENCYTLMEGRNAKYGDSWKRLTTQSIVDLMAMKLDRCQKQRLDDTAMEVELEDIVNYAIFGLIMVRKKL